MEPIEVKPKMMLLPPPAGHCRICAIRHEPDMPHDADSIFYQTRFQMRYGRDGTWADALAHCPTLVQHFWRTKLREMQRYTEPPQGVEPIKEAIDG